MVGSVQGPSPILVPPMNPFCIDAIIVQGVPLERLVYEEDGKARAEFFYDDFLCCQIWAGSPEAGDARIEPAPGPFNWWMAGAVAAAITAAVEWLVGLGDCP
jgi:hypothetical protein